MTSKNILSFFLIIVIISVIILSNSNEVFAEQEFLIASWNLKDFWGPLTYSNSDPVSPDKLQNFTLVLNGSNYPQVDKKYDIIFVQELKWDKDTNRSEAFDILCDNYLIDLDYVCDSVTGGTFSGNEGYGVIYRDGIDVEVNYTGHPLIIPHWEQQIKKKIDRMPEKLARPPMMAKVSVDGGVFEFIVFSNHIKPSQSLSGIDVDYREELEDRFGSYAPRIAKWIAFTEQELKIIFEKINDTEFDTKNIIVLGDLNADCDYLEKNLGSYDFIEDSWTILTPVDTRTNFAEDACWYDRIIVSSGMEQYLSVVGEPIGKYPHSNQEFRFIDSEFGLSDHKLIWAKFTIPSSISADPTVDLTVFSLTTEELETLGLGGTISVIIGGIIYEIKIRRDT